MALEQKTYTKLNLETTGHVFIETVDVFLNNGEEVGRGSTNRVPVAPEETLDGQDPLIAAICTNWRLFCSQ